MDNKVRQIQANLDLDVSQLSDGGYFDCRKDPSLQVSVCQSLLWVSHLFAEKSLWRE